MAAAQVSVVAMESDPFGTDTPVPAASVHVIASGFEVHNPTSTPCTVEVYALTGRSVMKTTAPSGVTSFSLSSGHYIVRINNKATKIVVR